MNLIFLSTNLPSSLAVWTSHPVFISTLFLTFLTNTFLKSLTCIGEPNFFLWIMISFRLFATLVSYAEWTYVHCSVNGFISFPRLNIWIFSFLISSSLNPSALPLNCLQSIGPSHHFHHYCLVQVNIVSHLSLSHSLPAALLSSYLWSIYHRGPQWWTYSSFCSNFTLSEATSLITVLGFLLLWRDHGNSYEGKHLMGFLTVSVHTYSNKTTPTYSKNAILLNSAISFGDHFSFKSLQLPNTIIYAYLLK